MAAGLPVDSVHDDEIVRFDRAERWLHWANATLVLVLLATGSILYVGSLSALVGRRALIKDIHVYSGLALPVPFLLLYAGRWRSGFRRDARRLGRFLHDDWRWLRTRGRATDLRLGKFNAGQKLNAIFVAGVLPVMLMTGSIMFWNKPFSRQLAHRRDLRPRLGIRRSVLRGRRPHREGDGRAGDASLDLPRFRTEELGRSAPPALARRGHRAGRGASTSDDASRKSRYLSDAGHEFGTFPSTMSRTATRRHTWTSASG